MTPPADDLTAHIERAAVALTEGRVDDLLRHARCAAHLVDEADVATHMRVAGLLQAGFRFSGDPEFFDQALAACLAIGNRTDQPQWAIPARALAGNVLMLAGRLFQAIEHCDAAVALAAACDLQQNRVAAMGHQFRGYVLMEWNHLDQAHEALMTAWSLSTERDRGVRSGVARMLAELSLARSDTTAAHTWCTTLAQIVSEPMTLRNREWLAAVRARQGFAFTRDLRALDAWQRRHDYRLDTLESLSDRAITARLHEFEHLLTMLEATGQWTSLGRLAAVVERGARPLRTGYLIRALCARAVSLEATGHGSEALAVWVAALEAGEVGGYVRAYLDGVPLRKRLLQRATDDPRGAPRARGVLSMTEGAPDVAMVSGLTDRQRDVLQLVADGLSDREIGRTTGLSVATVKTHLRAIYARLRARSRTDAVAKARAAGVL